MAESNNIFQLLCRFQDELHNHDIDTTITDILLRLENMPQVAKERNIYGNTPLHEACRSRAPMSVVTALLSAWPDAVQQKNTYFYTPLHTACCERASVDAVTALLSAWPDAVKQKDFYGNTLLHTACFHTASVEVVSALLNAWPNAAKERNNCGYTPLHAACSRKASLDVVSTLLSVWPDAVQKGAIRNNPLRCFRISFEVTILLVNAYLGDKENRCSSASLLPLKEDVSSSQTKDHKMLFHCLYSLYNDKTDNPSLEEIIQFFAQFKVWNGVAFVLEKDPALAQTMNLDTNVMADFLFMAGRCCELTTMWRVICNEQDLLEGV